MSMSMRSQWMDRGSGSSVLGSSSQTVRTAVPGTWAGPTLTASFPAGQTDGEGTWHCSLPGAALQRNALSDSRGHLCSHRRWSTGPRDFPFSL